MPQPNLFIVGAAKAGTTALYQYLNQNPQIFFPKIKEPHFFFKDLDTSHFRSDFKTKLDKNKGNLHQSFIRSEEEYLNLYTTAKEELYCGDASASYLYSKQAAREIYAFNKRAKVLIILRQPVERAFSHYLMNLRMGFSHKQFREDFINDLEKKEKGWGQSHLYLELGQYFEQVKRYVDIFPDAQLKLILHEDLKKDSQSVLNSIDKFLGIKEFDYKTDVQFNKAEIPRNRQLVSFVKRLQLQHLIPQSLLRKLKGVLFQSKNLPKLEDSERELFLKYFESDIKKLEALCSLNLRSWYESE